MRLNTTIGKCLATSVIALALTCLTHAQDNTPPAPEKATFFGVSTSPVSPVLRSHVDLPEGVGLVVTRVVPNSPAQHAGIEQYDIIQRLNDQLVINTSQFGVLVRSFEVGEEVHVDVVRRGEPRVVDVILGEHTRRPPLQPAVRIHGGNWPTDGVIKLGEGNEIQLPPITIDINSVKQAVEGFQQAAPQLDELKKLLGDEAFEKLEGIFQNAMPEELKQMKLGDLPVEVQTIIEAEAPAQAAADNAAAAQTAIVIGGDATSVSTFSDGQHTITVTNDADGKRVTAVDAAGSTVFEGPVNTDDEKKALPASIRDKIDKMDVQIHVIETNEQKPAAGAL